MSNHTKCDFLNAERLCVSLKIAFVSCGYFFIQVCETHEPGLLFVSSFTPSLFTSCCCASTAYLNSCFRHCVTKVLAVFNFSFAARRTESSYHGSDRFSSSFTHEYFCCEELISRKEMFCLTKCSSHMASLCAASPFFVVLGGGGGKQWIFKSLLSCLCVVVFLSVRPGVHLRSLCHD